jgi:hypothetical protein
VANDETITFEANDTRKDNFDTKSVELDKTLKRDTSSDNINGPKSVDEATDDNDNDAVLLVPVVDSATGSLLDRNDYKVGIQR